MKPTRRDLLRASGLLAAGAAIEPTGPASARPIDGAASDITAEEVARAIADGVIYLKRQQRQDGTWPEYPFYGGGLTALCALALLNAGCELDDDVVKRALAFLREFKPFSTYAASLQTMVFCAAEPKRDLHLIQRNVKWLESQQIRDGAASGMWSTPRAGSPDHIDNSMTHFAMLGLYEAERSGVPVTAETWRLALGYWQRVQNGDGSWGWGPGDDGTGSMTCAGIAAIIMASGQINAGDATVEGDVVRCCQDQQANSQLERALQWLQKRFSVERNPNAETWLSYYLYSLERACRLTARRFIGQHDWYREGAKALVRSQTLTGAWSPDVEFRVVNDENVSTSFSLMFLAKARWPVLLTQLQHRPLTDWNRHRRAIFNVVSHVETAWRLHLTYQVSEIAAASVDDLAAAPVLFLSGRESPEFSEEEQRKLRDYIDRGGFIFAMSNCGGNAFDEGFRKLTRALFPEPEFALAPLPVNHPAWYCETVVPAAHLPELWGLNVGCRTALIYCPQDLSCLWELARPEREHRYPPIVQERIRAACGVGVNILSYATNREVKFKDPSAIATQTAQSPARFERGVLYVAQLVRPGAGVSAPAAAANLLRFAEKSLKMRCHTEPRQVELNNAELFEYPLVFFHGRTEFKFSEAERERLHTYLVRGGTLLVDSICSNIAFAASFRREMATLFPDNPLEAIPEDHPVFGARFGGEEVKKVTRRGQLPGDQTPFKVRLHEDIPRLQGITLSQRLAVIFSPYDLSCALGGHESVDCEGYVRRDAARIAINVLLYALSQ